MSEPLTAAGAARMFHEAYERLAPDFGYRTREASAVPWDDVPEPNRSLMVAVAAEVVPVIAARAVDEALSVEALLPEDWTVDVCIVHTAAEVNGDEHRAAHRWHATAMHGEGHEMGAVDADGPTLPVALSNLAAALVAHLRGPRPEGEG